MHVHSLLWLFLCCKRSRKNDPQNHPYQQTCEESLCTRLWSCCSGPSGEEMLHPRTPTLPLHLEDLWVSDPAPQPTVPGNCCCEVMETDNFIFKLFISWCSAHQVSQEHDNSCQWNKRVLWQAFNWISSPSTPSINTTLKQLHSLFKKGKKPQWDPDKIHNFFWILKMHLILLLRCLQNNLSGFIKNSFICCQRIS